MTETGRRLRKMKNPGNELFPGFLSFSRLRLTLAELRSTTCGFETLMTCPRKHSSFLTCLKQDRIRYIFRFDKFSHRDQRDDDLFEFLIDPSRLCRAGRKDVAAPIPCRLFIPVIKAALPFNP